MRRSNDVSQNEGYSPSPTVTEHKIEQYGTHHARDVAELFKQSDIELNLKRPNYTIDSLRYISKTYPDNSFSLIIGEDNFVNFKKWRGYKEIVSYYKIYVYPRKTKLKTDMKLIVNNNIEMIEAPLIDLTSTNIRNNINDKDRAKAFISDRIYKYITTNNLYKLDNS